MELFYFLILYLILHYEFILIFFILVLFQILFSLNDMLWSEKLKHTSPAANTRERHTHFLIIRFNFQNSVLMVNFNQKACLIN